MTDYIYHGPMQGLTLHGEDGAVVWEGMLHPERPVTLPADHPHVVTLLAAEWLKPAPARKSPKPATADKEI